MLKSFKYRLYPTEQQKELLAKHFGCCRMVYNLGLEVKNMAYNGNKKSLSYNTLASQLTDLKTEYSWLSEVNSQSLQASLKNLDIAYTRFFKKIGSFPKFKKKSAKQSFQCPQNVWIDSEKGIVNLPKFKEGIKAIFHRRFTGETRTVTISKTPTNKYFASILVETGIAIPEIKPINENTTIGIDLGIKSFIVSSEGEKYDNPKYLKNSLTRLKVLSKRLSKKEKGSNRRKKAKLAVARLHEKVSNQRSDFLHKVSNEITNRHDTICMETLRVDNMLKNHKLAQSISDSGWGMFKEFVKYKCSWKGKNFLEIGTFEPSSKTCCECGSINELLTLKDREWVCADCGTLHDRDVNAGKNIKAFALKKSGAERSVGRMESLALAGAVKCEIFNIL
jgi:putative transposase